MYMYICFMKFAEKLVYVSYQSTSTSQKIVEFGSMFNMFVFNLKYIFLMLPDKNSKGSIYRYHLHLSYIWSKWFPDDLLRFMWWSSLFYDMKVYIKKIQVKRCFFMLCPFEKWKISKILLSSFIWHKSLFFFVITSGYKRKVRYDFDDDAIYHFWVMPLDT